MTTSNKSKHLKAIRQGMEDPSNQHEMVVVPEEELPHFWLSLKAEKGKLRGSQARLAQACFKDRVHRGQDLDESIRRRAGDRSDADTVREWVESALGNTGNVRAAVDAGRLLKDFRGLGEYYVKTYQGRRYVIFKGNHKLRRVIKGTRYSIDNAQILNLGIGKAGRRAAARSGTVLTIAVMGTYRVAEYILDDEVLLHHFVGRLSTDILKAGVSGAIGWGAGAMAASFALGGVVGPLLIGLAVAVGLGYLLDELDDHYKVTERLVDAMGQAVEEAQRLGKLTNQAKRQAQETLLDTVDAAIDSAFDEAERRARRAWRHFTAPIPLTGRGFGTGISLP